MPKFSRFNDSTEATEHMEKIQELLNDPRLVQWVAATARNYNPKILELFFEMQNANEMFQDMMDNCG